MLSEKKECKKLLVLYASETGVGKSISRQIQQDAPALGYAIECHCLCSFEKIGLNRSELWPACPILFIVSSTGEGEPPVHASSFWNCIKSKKLETYSLQSVDFALLGLGDSSYEGTFMMFPSMLYEKLIELGAKEIVEMGKADKAKGQFELYVDVWTTDWWQDLEEFTESSGMRDKISQVDSPDKGQTKLSIYTQLEEISPEINKKQIDLFTKTVHSEQAERDEMSLVTTPKTKTKSPAVSVKAYSHISKLKFLNSELPSSFESSFYYDNSMHSNSPPFTKETPFMAELIGASYLTSEDAEKQVIEMVLNLKDLNADFRPGDAIGILPKNDAKKVEHLISLLKLSHMKDLPFIIIPKDPNVPGSTQALPTHIKTPSTLKQVLTYAVDICGIAGRRLLMTLASYCSDRADHDKLTQWATCREKYNEFVEKRRLNVLDVLEEFTSCEPDISHLLDCLPPLMPRYFSMANYSKAKANFSFAFSVVDCLLFDAEKRFQGVCTNWLAALANSHLEKKEKIQGMIAIPIFKKPSSNFTLPEDPTRPIIMVGTGTGVSPFMSFLEKKRQDMSSGIKVGKTMLFVGYRHPLKDYLFKQKLEAFQKTGVLDSLIVAFSRFKDRTLYVQHRMQEPRYANELFQLMCTQNAIFYVCGDIRQVVPGIREAWTNILVSQGKTKAEAKELLIQWAESKRYILDIWG